MSNHDNARRGDKKRTEHGPTWESRNPGEGCNSTHVARARKKWKKRVRRAQRREVDDPSSWMHRPLKAHGGKRD